MKNGLVRLADWCGQCGTWLDDRTGYRRVLHKALYENIPGGSRWRYVTGSMLVFALLTQFVTGIFLWMAYSPSSQSAWESVYYIQNEMQGGWLLRGIHHFMAQAMVVLLPLHMLQVIVDKAYLAPREINFWTGLILGWLVLGLGLTGYLLPWDQKGYWATKVATNLASLAPLGTYLQKLMVGGTDYGHHTLSRFFAMHAGVLPALLILLLGLHLALFRRHGITAVASSQRADQFFWPHQVLKDGVACLVVLILVLVATLGLRNLPALLTGNLPPADQLGAELGPPADPAEEYSAARPEWYYLSLFQLLKKLKSEFIGAIVVPGAVTLYLFAMPLFAKLRYGHRVNVAVFALFLFGAAYLTVEAIYHDHVSRWVSAEPANPEARERYNASKNYLAAVAQTDHEYERTKELIESYGIPKEGAIHLMRSDPEIQGPRLFRQRCASCHSYLDHSGRGIASTAPSAPNLFGFATRIWLTGFLDPDRIKTAHYFGNTKHAEDGSMVDEVESLRNLSDEEATHLKNLVIALSAEAKLPEQAEEDLQAANDGTIAEGVQAFDAGLPTRCADCHYFHDFQDDDSGPNLTGYGSYDWLTRFISDPIHFYRENNDRMPSFAASREEPEKNLLNSREIDMLVRWIRGDDRDLAKKLDRRNNLAIPRRTVDAANLRQRAANFAGSDVRGVSAQ